MFENMMNRFKQKIKTKYQKYSQNEKYFNYEDTKLMKKATSETVFFPKLSLISAFFLIFASIDLYYYVVTNTYIHGSDLLFGNYTAILIIPFLQMLIIELLLGYKFGKDIKKGKLDLNQLNDDLNNTFIDDKRGL